MCLAIPMRIIEVRAVPAGGPLAVVEADGLRKEVRCDLLAEPVAVGDYLIIHAGFAINRLDEEEAKLSLSLLRELGSRLSQERGDDGEGQR